MPRVNINGKNVYKELEYLRILREEFASFLIPAEILNSTNPDDAPTEEALASHRVAVAFANLHLRLAKCLDKEEKGQELSPDDIKALDEYFDNFVKTTEAFIDGCENNPDFSIFAQAYNGRVKAALLPVKSYKAKFDEAKADPNKKFVLKDAIADISWAKGLIQKDPQAQDNYALPEEQQYKTNQHSIKENLDKYKDNMLEIARMFNEHVERISGDENNSYVTLEYKLEMLQDALATQFEAGKVPATFTQASGAFKFGSGMLGIDLAQKIHAEKHGPNDESIPLLNEYSCHTKQLFEFQLANTLDFTVLSGQMSEKDGLRPGCMDKETVKILEDNIKPLRLDPKYLALDPVIYDETTKIADMIVVAGGVTDALKNKSLDKNNATIKKIIQLGTNLNNKLYNYINDLSDDVPSVDEFSLFCDYLGTYIDKADDVTYRVRQGKKEKTVYNNDLSICLAGVKELASFVPGLEERYQGVFNKFKDRIKKQYDTDYRTILNSKLDSKGTYAIEDAMESIFVLNGQKVLPDGSYDKAYFMTMLRNPYFAQKEMEDVKDDVNRDAEKNHKGILYDRYVKKVLVAAIAKHEFESAVKYNNNIKDKFAMFRAGLNTATYPMFSDNKKKDSEIQAVEKFYDDFLNSPETKKLLEMDPETLKKVYDDQAFADKLIFGEGDKIIRSLSDDSLGVFFQSSADFFKSNSESYIRMAEEIKKIPTLEHKIGGIKPDDYKDLFGALSNYLNTHDTSPTFSNGKRRMRETASLLIKTSFEVSGKVSPEFQEAINDEMQLCMLRSANFRAVALETAGNKILKYSGAGKQLSKEEFDKLDPESKAELSFAMKVYAFGCRCTEEIQREYKKLEIGGKMNGPEEATQILKDFSGVRDYADLADNMNFDAVINMHQDFAKGQKHVDKAEPEAVKCIQYEAK